MTAGAGAAVGAEAGVDTGGGGCPALSTAGLGAKAAVGPAAGALFAAGSGADPEPVRAAVVRVSWLLPTEHGPGLA